MIGISASKQAKLNNGQIANGYTTGDNAEDREGQKKRERKREWGGGRKRRVRRAEHKIARKQ